ncbi:ester cyclase [Corallococcus carmarthensis]|uniref:Ester cyclase n=2 Tax=Corallococcus carmarthensis TaxID=2316728 RepID=A0A3A8KDN3_9BACT|nr:ester cyclase [Corallococcus carmarthensis]RKH06070.1 ester cyclase [Corallococcus carmarthensis]
MRTCVSWVVVGLVGLTGCATVSPAERARQVGESNKERARLFTEEIYNQKRLERIPEYVAADFVDRSEGAPQELRGPDVVRTQAEQGFTLFPDLKFELLHVMAEDDWVLVRWRATGTDTQGPPTLGGKSRPVTFHGDSLYRLRDGRLVESWDLTDRLAPLLQRGFKIVPPDP